MKYKSSEAYLTLKRGGNALPVLRALMCWMTDSEAQNQTIMRNCKLAIKQMWESVFCRRVSPGAIHLQFHASGNHYVWRKVTSTVHNIIVGKLWIDQVCLLCLLYRHHALIPLSFLKSRRYFLLAEVCGTDQQSRTEEGNQHKAL